ncbi:MAG: hypothetical protein Q9174_007437, partial [Haloplaca sp. 1 TL-2023]
MASPNELRILAANNAVALQASTKKRRIDEDHQDAPASKRLSSDYNDVYPATDQMKRSIRQRSSASMKRKLDTVVEEQDGAASAEDIQNAGSPNGLRRDIDRTLSTNNDVSEYDEAEAQGHSAKRLRTDHSLSTKTPLRAQTSTGDASGRSLSVSAATKSSTGLGSMSLSCKFTYYPTTRRHHPSNSSPSKNIPSNGPSQTPHPATSAPPSLPRCQALVHDPRFQSAPPKPVSGTIKAKPSALGVSSISKTNMKSTNPSDIAADRIERGQPLAALLPDTRPTQTLATTRSRPGSLLDDGHAGLDERIKAGREAARAMEIEDREDKNQRRDIIRRRNRLRNDQREAEALEAEKATRRETITPAT